MQAEIITSRSVQDFLKGVYALQERMERVSTNAMAALLSISAPSVTDMAQRLLAAGLVNYEKYHGISLTEAGAQEALRIIRRHRLIEMYLVNHLGYALNEVHDEAERMEHAVSDRFMEALANKLDNPVCDPYGEVIPASDGTILRRDLSPLVTLPIGEKATIARLSSDDPHILEHLLSKGFAVGTQIKTVSIDPFNGPLMVLIDGKPVIVGYAVATAVSVEPYTRANQ